jgi:fructokinase
MERTIYTIGESLFDLIFYKDIPITAKPGGSLLNSSVSLAKSGNKISFVSELGNDDIGKIIMKNLCDNGIDITNIKLYNENKTAIAIAFLDKNKNANYSFYKDYPLNRKLFNIEITKDDILMFGSIYGITEEIRASILAILQKANQNNALILYDPNIRKQIKFSNYNTYINENISQSDIIKASNEDLFNLFGKTSYIEVYERIKEIGCNNLIITQNKKDVLVFTPEFYLEIKVPDIDVVSSIGAGDAFNAGIIHEMIKQNMFKHSFVDLNTESWKKIIDTGILFASDVCMSYDNSISDKLAEKMID